MRLEIYSLQHRNPKFIDELIIYAQQPLFLSIFQYSDETRNSLSNRYMKNQND